MVLYTEPATKGISQEGKQMPHVEEEQRTETRAEGLVTSAHRSSRVYLIHSETATSTSFFFFVDDRNCE